MTFLVALLLSSPPADGPARAAWARLTHDATDPDWCYREFPTYQECDKALAKCSEDLCYIRGRRVDAIVDYACRPEWDRFWFDAQADAQARHDAWAALRHAQWMMEPTPWTPSPVMWNSWRFYARTDLETLRDLIGPEAFDARRMPEPGVWDGR